MSDREQLEAEAEELYPITKALDVDHTAIVIAHRSTHVRAKTVTAEQVEAAAVVLAEMNGEPRPGRFERTITRAAFRAAGFLIEGDGDG